jgi:hypothetical protein
VHGLLRGRDARTIFPVEEVERFCGSPRDGSSVFMMGIVRIAVFPLWRYFCSAEMMELIGLLNIMLSSWSCSSIIGIYFEIKLARSRNKQCAIAVLPYSSLNVL